ncbi:uncharacterized protein A4U43_C07F16610 [Asparagus officinalis]|uniref:Uncharacterized protein n=1 Tax=Asparagus officinalis TaxID=4686 RepID=A0A5P1EFG5_ASPOF|nr:uncharacterized protein A4U43_C07F16610 [Asparagus officinalis]
MEELEEAIEEVQRKKKQKKDIKIHILMETMKEIDTSSSPPLKTLSRRELNELVGIDVDVLRARRGRVMAKADDLLSIVDSNDDTDTSRCLNHNQVHCDAASAVRDRVARPPCSWGYFVPRVDDLIVALQEED